MVDGEGPCGPPQEKMCLKYVFFICSTLAFGVFLLPAIIFFEAFGFSVCLLFVLVVMRSFSTERATNIKGKFLELIFTQGTLLGDRG